MIFLPFDHLQPSQLYISQEKLARVQAGFPALRPEALEPIPVIHLDGAVVLTDGHTRACAALLSGWQTLPVTWDEDKLDLEAYRICVRWCQEEGITSILPLVGRVIPGEAYQIRWLDRCQAMHEQLERIRGGRA